jgi:glycosyltransferase involved in cell wall biosynthesis
MHIAVNARLFIKNRIDGIGRYAWETVSRMVLDHPEDHFYFFFDRPWDKEFIISPNIHPVLVWPPCRHPSLFYIWFEWRLPQLFKKYKIDVFYSPDGFISLSTNVPTLMVSHDLSYLHYPQFIPPLQRWYYRFFVKKFHKHSEHIVTVSHFTKNDIMDQLLVPAEKVSVAYNAITKDFFMKDTTIDNITETPYFVFIGTLHPRKNIDRLLNAFDIFKKETNLPHQLHLIGACMWNCKEYRDRVASSPWSADILHFKGLKDVELIMQLRKATALVYPSMFEGFGIPIIEAMALGVPVITSNVSSMPEVAGDAALLIDPESVEQIAHSMKNLVTQPELKKDLILRGRENIKRFSWEKTSEQIYEKLKEIFASSNESK